jgi:hypothetical protein
MTLQVGSEPVRLEGFTVEGVHRCRMPVDDGELIARVWQEARKALAAALATQTQAPPIVRARDYVRTLDVVDLALLDQRVRRWSGLTSSPYFPAPPEDLEESGFVRREADGNRYYGLAPETVLSDAFERTHCFALLLPTEKPGGDEIGVAFEPVPGRKVPDVKGVLWVSRETAELRRVEYSYTNHLAAVPLPLDRFGGRADFRRLEDGRWIVEQWWIRMPQFKRVVSSNELPNGSEVVGEFNDADARWRFRWIGLTILEVGGTVLSVEPNAGASRGTAVLRGTIHDSLSGAPLEGAVVYVVGTGRDARTDADGAFVIDALPAGSWEVSYQYERMDALRFSPEPELIRLTDGDTIQLSLAVPGAATVLGRRCKVPEDALFGFVWSGEGKLPLAGVSVVAEWIERWRVRGEGELQGEVRSRGTMTDPAGAYVICDVPSGVLVTVGADLGGEGRRSEARIETRAEGSSRRVDLVIDGSGSRHGR